MTGWPTAPHTSSEQTEIGVYFEVWGKYGVPSRGTTHKYLVGISQDKIVTAVTDMLAESSNPNLSEPVSLLLRELLAED